MHSRSAACISTGTVTECCRVVEPPSKEYVKDKSNGDAYQLFPHAACISPGTVSECCRVVEQPSKEYNKNEAYGGVEK